MKRPVASLLLFFLIALCSAKSGISATALPRSPSEGTGAIPTILRNGKQSVAVTNFFERLGYTWEWDPSAQQLFCARGAAGFVFTQDIPFYTYDKNLFPLAAAPERIGATLYLPPALLVAIFKESGGEKVRWDSVAQTLTVGSASKIITAVTCEKKQNNILVTIELADSTPFDCTYHYPSVALNFLGATADTAHVRPVRRIGIVDSLFATQSKESARISLILNREIEEPQIDYLEDQHTVLVSIKPKNAATGAAVAEAAAGGIQTIVIDAGHGGIDPGAIGPSGEKEKDVVLNIALELRDLLKKMRGLKVFMTREKDQFVPLSGRTKMANELKADLFISIHANATGGSQKKKETTRGYKAYFLSQAKNEEDKLVAMRENAVIKLEEKPQNYGALKNVLIDLAGNEYLRESQDLCISLDQQFGALLHDKIGRQQWGIGQANFWVLNGAYMPSILIETGFISSLPEEKLLSDKSVQKEIAVAIYDAVINFKKKYETGL